MDIFVSPYNLTLLFSVCVFFFFLFLIMHLLNFSLLVRHLSVPFPSVGSILTWLVDNAVT